MASTAVVSSAVAPAAIVASAADALTDTEEVVGAAVAEGSKCDATSMEDVASATGATARPAAGTDCAAALAAWLLDGSLVITFLLGEGDWLRTSCDVDKGGGVSGTVD